jgi:imidazolonepropionase-like amidohydrolase
LIDTHVHLCGDSGPRALDQLCELSPEQLADVITDAFRVHLDTGTTTVRDLGDVDFAVLDRRDDLDGPTVAAAGPPITSVAGHCAVMGGEVAGVDEITAAVRERADRGTDLVKVTTSGGAMSMNTDVTKCQFTVAELRAAVDEAHRRGLPITAHAHALPAVEMCV